jgi:cellobiose phosphorylase
MYRLGLEAILGLHRRGNELHIRPCIPKDWPSYEIVYRFGRSSYHIHVENNPDENGQDIRITLDEKSVETNAIPLIDDGREHHVTLVLGKVKARQE